MRYRALGCLALVGLLPMEALAQAERYELGRRLKLLEATWETKPDAKDQARALVGLPKVTQQFFSFQFGEAGRTLDTARFALLSADPPSEARRWMEPIYFVPATRLLDAKAEELRLTIQQFYKPDGAKPEQVTFTFALGQEKPIPGKFDKFPILAKVPLPPGLPPGAADDIPLTLTIRANGQESISHSVLVSRVAQLEERLARLKAVLDQPSEKPSIERATLADRLDMLKLLANGNTLETDYPAGLLLREAEAIRAAGLEKPFFTADKSGQFWLSVPTANGKQTACRIFVPKNLDRKKPVPTVVALHGAGGSENLFFEGYGAGQIVKECERRGWLLVATRSGLGFGLGGPPPVGEILDALGPRYPIDAQKVFLVGHSMGASQAVELLQSNAKRFAGAAVLGGGGRIRKADPLKNIPVFVGVGSKDFALGGAKSLHRALEEAGAKSTFKEYPDIEHMIIVRVALPDVFAMFDKLNRPVH